MKVDIRVPVGLPVLETAEFISECEKAGFSGVGVHDHQHSGRDVFLTLAMAAGKTERLTLYPATSNPVTRHPMVLASLAHSLEEIAPGRVRLTVGPGYLAVGNIGRRRASLEVMRRSILDIRSLLRGERVEFNPVETRLGLHPAAVRAARRRLEIGAARAGRDLDAFQTVHITPATIAEDGDAARRWPQLWFRPGQPYLKYPSDSNLVWLREAGIHLPDSFVQVFIFPTHTQEGGYDMPVRELEAFRDVIIPGIEAAHWT